MVTPDSEFGILLSAMGEYADQPHDPDRPAAVRDNWAFYERRTGFGRDMICRLLPTLVELRLADEMGQATGYRAADGAAWISAQGRALLSEWEHPAPPIPVEVTLSPGMLEQLQTLASQAADQGITRADIDRIEALLEDVADNTKPNRVEQGADTTQVIQFLAVYLWPLVRGVIPD